MIEATVRTYLKAALDVPVLLERPKVPEDFSEIPEKYVVLEKIAESVTNHIRTASIALQSYATERLYEAAQLDEEVRNAMDSMTELDSISAAHLSSNYNHTDDRTGQYRYQSVYDITYY